MKKDLIIYVSCFLIIFFSLLLIKINYENIYKFKTNNYFTENNEIGLLSFIFIETEELSEIEIKNHSKKVFKEHKSLDIHQDSTKVLIIYYFNKLDSAKIPNEYLSRLKIKYPKVNNLSQKINYYPNGYVYTNYKSKRKVKNIAKDSLFKTAVFAPKSGVNAKEILKN
jgi:hypothetical protein